MKQSHAMVSASLKDTHLTERVPFVMLRGLLAQSVDWIYRNGEHLHDGSSPILPKNRCLVPSSPSLVTDSIASGKPV